MVLPRYRFYGGMGTYREALASLLMRRTYRGGELDAVERVVRERLGVPYAVAARLN
jgi:hypothetical protein